MRLPDYPRAGLLSWVLKKAKLTWLSWRFPEDFLQEVHEFFLVWGGVATSDKEFLAAAQRHFYAMAVSYGWKKERGMVGYHSREYSLSPPKLAEEFGTSLGRTDRALNYDPWPAIEANMDFAEVAEAAKNVVESPAEWEMLKAFLAGRTALDLAMMIGKPVSQVERQLNTLFARIRAALGIEIEGDEKVLLPRRKRGAKTPTTAPNKPVVTDRKAVPIDVDALKSLSTRELATVLGVSRATAHRAKVKGWYVPDHPNTKAKAAARPPLSPTAPKRPGQVVYVDTTLSVGEIMEAHQVSRSTAFRIRRNGWFLNDHHNRRVRPGTPDEEQFA